jgi:hypothetical protein
MSKKRSTSQTINPLPSAARKASLAASSGLDTAKTAGRPAVAPSKDRKGKRSIAIYMDQIVKDELDAIALRERRSIQDLGLEAINLLLVRYGHKTIA